MAYNNPISHLLALVLFITVVSSSAPVVHSFNSLKTASHNITQATIVGQFVCSVTGTPTPGTDSPGLDREQVSLICNGVSITSNVTNTTGHYEVSVNTTALASFEPAFCVMRVSLPVENCTLLPSQGFLQAPIALADIVASAVGEIALFIGGLLGVCVNEYCT